MISSGLIEIERVYHMSAEKREIICSFCWKLESQVQNIISGLEVTICDECVEKCYNIIAKERDSPAPKKKLVITPAINAQIIKKEIDIVEKVTRRLEKASAETAASTKKLSEVLKELSQKD